MNTEQNTEQMVWPVLCRKVTECQAVSPVLDVHCASFQETECGSCVSVNSLWQKDPVSGEESGYFCAVCFAAATEPFNSVNCSLEMAIEYLVFRHLGSDSVYERALSHFAF